MKRLLSQLLAVGLSVASYLGGFAVMASPDCEGEMTGMKGEVKVLSPEVTGVKVDIHYGGNTGEAQAPPGDDRERAGKGPVGTSYEGRAVNCRPIEGSTMLDCSGSGQ